MSTEIMWKPKRNNAHEITQQKQTHREHKLEVTSRERKGKGGKIRVWDEKIQTTMYKISNKDRAHGSIATVLQSFKQSMIYKNTESLCCIPETNIL